MMRVHPYAIIFSPNGRSRVYILRTTWIWVMTYDHRTGEIKQYIPRESIQ